MAEHSPGPWRIGTVPANDGSIAILSEDDRVASVHGFAEPMTRSRGAEKSQHGVANARLIAASPDLLEACIAIDAAIDGGIQDAVSEARKILRAAITKAQTGG
jgi:hypothetical protein